MEVLVVAERVAAGTVLVEAVKEMAAVATVVAEVPAAVGMGAEGKVGAATAGVGVTAGED